MLALLETEKQVRINWMNGTADDGWKVRKILFCKKILQFELISIGRITQPLMESILKLWQFLIHQLML